MVVSTHNNLQSQTFHSSYVSAEVKNVTSHALEQCSCWYENFVKIPRNSLLRTDEGTLHKRNKLKIYGWMSSKGIYSLRWIAPYCIHKVAAVRSKLIHSLQQSLWGRNYSADFMHESHLGSAKRCNGLFNQCRYRCSSATITLITMRPPGMLKIKEWRNVLI